MVINRIESEKDQLIREKSDIGMYDTKLREAGNEIDRLNRILQDQSREINNLREENKQLSYQISNVSILQKENQDLRQRVGEADNYKRIITEY